MKIAAYILSGLIIAYLVIGFIHMDWDVVNWPSGNRLMMVYFGGCAAGVLAFVQEVRANL